MARTARIKDNGFDVVCTIGRVDLVDCGPHSPSEAAFLLIGQHNAPGVYSFPAENGGTMHVTVEVDDTID